ncbi:hypothetical protein B0T17DRAFT_617762 [Bombardia bombarda]|uniref:CRIB domain-containing protein n=1 Tax=Bombardia bombarda TaxID=252184 RepID=A0AA39WTG5_9PEZI|nr:hypothetical protein B0T17DRAFT_617762 [Bombardia bombarda]
MNMWAVSNMPVYPRERATSRASKADTTAEPSSTVSDQSAQVSPTSSDFPHHDADISGLLEPAIDGPPSPESIRALSKQLKWASAKDKHLSHHTSSSGSSSLLSLASVDRPSWENAIEGLSLSRKSSGRSTGRPMAANMASRERPDSVQIFGKTIFSRKGRLRRDTASAQSSHSGTQSPAPDSMYPNEAGNDSILSLIPTPLPIRESTLPGIFGRRRAARQQEQAAEEAPKFKISGPYNFQHVTHTQKDTVPDLQRSSRGALVSEFSQLRIPPVPPIPGMLQGIRAQDLHFADFSSDFLPLNEEGGELPNAPEPHTRITLSRPSSIVAKHLSARRIVKHTRSQEQLALPPAPPRPPRSPLELAFAQAPPIPPPRISSRMSGRHDSFDQAVNGPLDRPQTSSGFRHPRPFSPSNEPTSPPSTSHGFVLSPDMNTIPEDSNPYFPSVSDDANWPLPIPPSATRLDAPLPNVPEEEESPPIPSRRSRGSLVRTPSLRGSQSVPVLRPMSLLQDEESRRRSSAASETLGRLDLFAAQRALKAALIEVDEADDTDTEPLGRESWEDDIDYCYEHAAEADCDYAWDRPSLDISRDDGSTTPVEGLGRRSNQPGDVSLNLLVPTQFDLPALSPTSQISSAGGHEAITPTVLALPKPSNFSHPRIEDSNLLSVRRLSDVSSFKESHGFTLSPSLLVPGDYQQQMFASEPEIPDVREFSYQDYEDTMLNMAASSALSQQNRASASTTYTNDSYHTGFERHISTASSATDFTRLTQSTSSLDIESCLSKPEPLDRFPSCESLYRAESKSAMPTVSESDEVVVSSPSEPAVLRRYFMSRGSDPNLMGRVAKDEQQSGGSIGKWKDSIQARRQRARTASLSTPPPPNQYALFPSVQQKQNTMNGASF